MESSKITMLFYLLLYLATVVTYCPETDLPPPQKNILHLFTLRCAAHKLYKNYLPITQLLPPIVQHKFASYLLPKPQE